MYYVYCHTNKQNGKKYVGVTNNIKRRWRCGGVEYRPSKGKMTSRPFYNAICKYGFDSFSHEVLATFETCEEAFEAEKHYIESLQSDDMKLGYNISPGGNGGRVYKEHPRNMLGKPQTEYQIAHQKAFMSDNKNNPMLNGSVRWGETHPHPRGFAGKKRTDEWKEDMRQQMIESGHRCIPLVVVYPDGRTEEYKSMKAAEAGLGLTKPVILRIIRSGLPYEIKARNGTTDLIKHLEGIVVTRETIPR